MLQVSQLIIMNQANHKQSPATPIRYSSRHKIFSKRESVQSSHRSTQQDQFYKLLAKIRSLQDDIRALVEKNQQIQIENHELMKIENQTETAIAMQQDEMLSLNQRIEFQQSATENIIEYQRKLQEVGAQVGLLTQLIIHKNKKYQMLKFQNEKIVHQNLKLKEEQNKFQYEEIQTEQKIDQLIDLFDPQRQLTLEDDLPQKIEKIVDECRNLQQKIANKEKIIENIRKEAALAVMQEKEKQIKIQYNFKLLNQRARDVDQQSNYFVNCYNQESIKTVIDDMLLKQHALRKELDQQLQLNSAFQCQTQQAIGTAKKRVQRERNTLLQELRLQKMENEMHLRKKQHAEGDYRLVTSQTLILQQQTTHISQQVIQGNVQIYNRIKMLESQNIDLQISLARTNQEILLLHQQLNI